MELRGILKRSEKSMHKLTMALAIQLLSGFATMRNAAVALSALSAGEAQFYSGSANGSVLGAIANGLDLAFVAGWAKK